MLKGAMLFHVWGARDHRPTRDLDLLGFGSFAEADVRETILNVLATQVADDGLHFDLASLKVSRIREDDAYGGIRAEVRYRLAEMQLKLQIDVGIGDAIVPPAESTDFPTLLGDEAPRLQAYRRETVVAEKLHAMVLLGLGNSRMKDFYDVAYLADHFDFDGRLLADAIAATFQRRRTTIPTTSPLALTSAFSEDDTKQVQWEAFLRRSRLGNDNLPAVVDRIAAFLALPLRHAAMERTCDDWWHPGKGWVR